MLVVMKRDCPASEVDRVLRVVEELGLEGHPLPLRDRTAISVTRGPKPFDPGLVARLPGVARVLPLSRPARRAGREDHAEDTVVEVAGRRVGGGGLTLIAGPCAVESEEQIVSVARAVRDAGADLLRGGAYKPRTSPYSFQGLGPEGLHMLAAAREETGLPIVTEAVDEASLERVVRHADVVQIGARNMQNFALLRAVGRAGLPVLLKRGLSASLEDLLLSAEYVMSEGNGDVILCERGIRTFADHSRYTLDLSIVPALHELSHLPVLVDPSHGTGTREYVAPMARAAVAAGADGVMIEVHAAPHEALCDGPQALEPARFATLAGELRALRLAVEPRTETVP
jgi:3-deoxy-7-phosphoheptulonate synthase